MRVSNKDSFNIVLILGLHSNKTLAAASLSGVCVSRQPLDVAGISKSNYALVALNQVLDINIVLAVNNFGTAVVSILSLNLSKLFLNDILNLEVPSGTVGGLIAGI